MVKNQILVFSSCCFVTLVTKILKLFVNFVGICGNVATLPVSGLCCPKISKLRFSFLKMDAYFDSKLKLAFILIAHVRSF